MQIHWKSNIESKLKISGQEGEKKKMKEWNRKSIGHNPKKKKHRWNSRSIFASMRSWFLLFDSFSLTRHNCHFSQNANKIHYTVSSRARFYWFSFSIFLSPPKSVFYQVTFIFHCNLVHSFSRLCRNLGRRNTKYRTQKSK